MIPKVIGLKKTGATRGVFSEVVGYAGRDGEEARQKGLDPLDASACGVLNLDADAGTTDDRETIAAIMNATAMRSRRMKNNPVYHFSVSWVEGEHPTREQCEKTVEHFVNGLGMGECETFWAIHRDTDNDHVHVIVNTVHPERGIVAGPPRFDYRVLAKLAREVELAQGWQRDAGYYVTVEAEPGQARIMRRSEAIRRGLWSEHNTQRAPLSQAAARAEHNLGGDSFQTWVAEKPATALRQAIDAPGATWDDAHAGLARYGVMLEPKGSGMIVRTTTDEGRTLTAKASQLGRWAGRAALEKRLGAYRPAREPAQSGAQPHEQTYAQAMRAQRNADVLPPHGSADSNDPQRAAKREARAAARSALGERFEKEQTSIRANRRAQRGTHQTERRTLRMWRLRFFWTQIWGKTAVQEWSFGC